MRGDRRSEDNEEGVGASEVWGGREEGVDWEE